MNEVFFDYDPEYDSLFIYKKTKIRGSIEIGDIIVDISVDGKIKGIEILNASEMLKNLGVKAPEDVLNNIRRVSIRAIYKPDSMMIYYSIVSKTREVSSSIAVPVKVR